MTSRPRDLVCHLRLLYVRRRTRPRHLWNEQADDGSGYAAQMVVCAVPQLPSSLWSSPWVTRSQGPHTPYPTGTTTISTSLVGALCVITGRVVSLMKSSFPAPSSILADME